MTQSELIKQLAGRVGCSHEQAKRLLGGLSAIITKTLTTDTVDVPGIGKFGVKVSAARTGRNPATGESVEIPAKRKVSFKPGKTLRDAVA